MAEAASAMRLSCVRGFVASQTRERIYVAVGLVAGLFSLALGLVYVFGMDALVPEMDSLLPF